MGYKTNGDKLNFSGNQIILWLYEFNRERDMLWFFESK